MAALAGDLASQANDIATRIDVNGYAVVEGFVSPEKLAKAQAFVRQTVIRNGGQYIVLPGKRDLGGTFLERLPIETDFIDLCRCIYVRGTDVPPPDVEFYQILRCLSGAQVKRHSMRFHYDSYVLTALIPIVMPSHGQNGNLIIIPKLRPIRNWYLANLLDKVLAHNPLSQKAFRIAHKKGSSRVIRIALKPGNLYFFWGYRSLHTNEPCEPDEIRSTALLHYGDPHARSRFKQLVGIAGLRPN